MPRASIQRRGDEDSGQVRGAASRWADAEPGTGDLLTRPPTVHSGQKSAGICKEKGGQLRCEQPSRCATGSEGGVSRRGVGLSELQVHGETENDPEKEEEATQTTRQPEEEGKEEESKRGKTQEEAGAKRKSKRGSRGKCKKRQDDFGFQVPWELDGFGRKRIDGGGKGCVEASGQHRSVAAAPCGQRIDSVADQYGVANGRQREANVAAQSGQHGCLAAVLVADNNGSENLGQRVASDAALGQLDDNAAVQDDNGGQRMSSDAALGQLDVNAAVHGPEVVGKSQSKQVCLEIMGVMRPFLDDMFEKARADNETIWKKIECVLLKVETLSSRVLELEIRVAELEYWKHIETKQESEYDSENAWDMESCVEMLKGKRNVENFVSQHSSLQGAEVLWGGPPNSWMTSLLL